jgi:UDP-glucose:(heptosyl)LPS alpha-1,3-glucosyltransferase
VRIVSAESQGVHIAVKIALVADRFDPLAGGREQWTVGFAAYLQGHGHEVHVLAFSEANHTLPVCSHILPQARRMLDRARIVAGSIATLKPDVVHDGGTSWSGQVFHPHTGSRLLSEVALRAARPMSYRLRTALSPRRRRYHWQLDRLERLQARNARRIVALSRRLGALLAERHGIPADRITVIPNGVDTQHFAPERLAELAQSARRALGIGDGPLFLGVAHNLRLKGVDTTLRALAVLRQEGADATLAVAGGTADAFWTGLATRLGVRDHVQFLGPVADMASLYAAADVLVHPTRWDACCLATIEGLAAGLPVITTAMDGASELIASGQSGFVLPDPEDVATLAAHMRRLLHPGTRSGIGAAARDVALRHDSRDNFRAVEAVLAQVADECRQ